MLRKKINYTLLAFVSTAFLLLCLFAMKFHTRKIPYQCPISASAQSYFVIDEDGTLWGWGDNYYGAMPQMPYSIGFSTNIPIMEHCISVYSSQWTLFSVDDKNCLWGIGVNANGKIPGKPDSMEEYEPYKIMDNVVRFCAGPFHCAAVKEDGSLWGWGLSDSLGTTNVGQIILGPMLISENVYFAASGNDITYFIQEDHSLWVLNGYFLIQIVRK